MFSMDVPGSNIGKFLTFFIHLFTCSDCSIRVSRLYNLQLFGYSIAVNVISFKP